MAYKNAIMADDEVLVNSFTRARELGRAVHGARRERRAGLPAAAAAARRRASPGPRAIRSRVRRRSRARPPTAPSASPRCSGVPLYLVHTSCTDALEAITRARLEGQRVFAEVLAEHLVIDDSVYREPGLGPRGRTRDEPAVPRQGAPGGAVARPAGRHAADHGHRSLLLLHAAEARRAGRLPQDPQRHRRRRGSHGACSGTTACAPAG